jgi:prepilin peptidase CpaA
MDTLREVPPIAGVALAVLGLLWAASRDVARYEIPNSACGVVAAGYLLAGAGGVDAPWLAGLATGLVVFAIGFALFARGWVGGGDVKLAAAAALWAGPLRMADFALVTGVAGAGLAVLMLTPLRRRLPAPPEAVAQDFRQPMPFGVPLAAGGAWVALLHLASQR